MVQEDKTTESEADKPLISMEPGLTEADPSTPKKDLTGIKYVGSADVKRLSVETLATLSIEAKQGLRWDSQNDHTVDVKDVNAATLEYLRSQPDFLVF